MAKKTGSKREVRFGELSAEQTILEEKIKKAVKDNDDYAIKKYDLQLKNVNYRLLAC